MAFWLAEKREEQEFDHIRRFDPRFWTVNFPRPMVASVVSTDVDAMRIDATFLRKADLAGLIWDSTDRYDHPLLAYKTVKDYSRTTLSFRWRSGGIIPLDGIHGPTLTIEGRDAEGNARTWYVRLWNYAVGGIEDAQITLPFSSLEGGFFLPDDADPVWPGDIDRMFISLVAPDFEPGLDEPLDSLVEGWVEISEIRCDGNHALIEIGDVMIPAHGLAVATGFNDNGVVTPARLLRNIRELGYRGSIVHYVGMSHYFRLEHRDEAYLAVKSGDPLNAPTRQWHEDFFRICTESGYRPVASLSYELLAQNCPPEWMQRDHLGAPALTGWDPPSSLLSPANGEAMAWLQYVAGEFVGLMVAAGAEVRFQVGEPWWWIFADGRICLYDDAAKAAFGGAPPAIADMRASLSSAQTDLLDAAGALLAQSTSALVAAARNAAGGIAFESLLLVFPPTLLDPTMPEARRADLPLAWAHPAFDRLQVEDYDWLTAGADAYRRSGYATIDARLGYPPEEQDYFAGFVLTSEQRDLWRRIDAGIDEARQREPHEIVVWAMPQVMRDGYTRLPEPLESDTMQAFDDVHYPLALGRDATVIPEFSTNVMVTASGFERRNSLWSNARLRFDVGPGIRSETELGDLIAFYRARRGPARGFLLRDPSDYSSNGMVGTPTPSDQLLGHGDGERSLFALIKTYGEGSATQERRITRPRFETLLVSINGTLAVGGWTLLDGGVIFFEDPPTDGSEVRAGFVFDVPVRFAEDQLEISGTAFAAGEAPSVPVVEVREAA
jgi:uncharacterized protein (TIGR02217 family)